VQSYEYFAISQIIALALPARFLKAIFNCKCLKFNVFHKDKSIRDIPDFRELEVFILCSIVFLTHSFFTSFSNFPNMEILRLKSEMSLLSNKLKSSGETIGFVPTMGALHPGHIKLVQKAIEENDKVVCSIFVNPIQFNNPDDLKKYPRTFEKDISMLKEVGCNFVFAPEADEMYPDKVTQKYEFGLLDMIMEGKFRPGHFNGVAVVVKKLFDIVTPHRAYFGEKDYQQLAVIRELVNIEKIAVEIIACKTVREPDGLAMSSRNKRLTHEQRIQAPLIFRALSKIPELAKSKSVEEIGNIIENTINENSLMKLEYFEISDAKTLAPLQTLEPGTGAVACIAVFMGDVRLIDNITFNC